MANGVTGKLKKGFTTGTCAAAGAKAAAMALFALPGRIEIKSVSVTLPSKKTVEIPIDSVRIYKNRVSAAVIKDAGDDPDVTNGAEIAVDVERLPKKQKTPKVVIKGGKGVGIVTRPGLKVKPGRPAINPVPLAMIKRAVLEAGGKARVTPSVTVTVSVPEGEKLALKTMNPRLGIVGGISILGTSGIVEPMSLDAYRHSISLGVDVALANGSDAVVYSTGRSSEKAAQKFLSGLPETAFVLTGDHMGHALKYARKKSALKKVVIAGQFAKFSKLAAGHFETHCSDSSVELSFLADLCSRLGFGAGLVKKVEKANTAREVFFLLKEADGRAVFEAVCGLVKRNGEKIIGKGRMVQCVLAGYHNDAVCVC